MKSPSMGAFPATIQQFRKSLAKNIKRGMVEQAARGPGRGGHCYGYRLEVLVDDRQEKQAKSSR